MDGLKSFYSSVEAGMDHVLNSDQKVAYFHNIDYVNSIRKTHCKVTIILTYSKVQQSLISKRLK